MKIRNRQAHSFHKGRIDAEKGVDPRPPKDSRLIGFYETAYYFHKKMGEVNRSPFRYMKAALTKGN